MQKTPWKDLKPTVFCDLIAMNALYRPGPMEYIPSFIKRKHGIEPIVYDLDACEEYLKETYGITVYQEQVMLLSQKLAGFSKGDADVLRKAMGKKQKAVLDKMKPKFVAQAVEKGHNAKVLEKIWTDWEAFARGAIRFGMGAVKGVGAGAVDTIVQTREGNPFKSVFDMAKRIDFVLLTKSVRKFGLCWRIY
ncbi:hypothetical protein FQR65_LT16756 [Abscondita terminalis]|nr:hypothetical protein FQR65_LT16756 [Abscondita terminalis]